ncbi:hypothetical protein [Microvirga sp. M2]|uniref:hypothetical protein n=1 Tax=Microvirga sp. M2 TaxID=3073270 RepID=UPI0039C0A779
MAGLAAHRHIRAMGTSWGAIFRPQSRIRPGDVIVRTVYEYGIDHARAAEARMNGMDS